jgi:hypothetical protein
MLGMTTVAHIVGLRKVFVERLDGDWTGPACFLANPNQASEFKSSTLPTAPSLRGESTAETDEEARQASCLATPYVLRSEDDFRMAHVQQMQRLVQEREVTLQLR